MKFVGIDPGSKNVAYATADREHITGYGKMTLHPLDKWVELFQGTDIVAIEGQYLGINVRSLITLVHAAGELSACAKLAGAEAETVAPSIWQRAMIKMKHSAKREVNKRMSKVVASALVDEKIVDNDIADAILICEYIRQKRAVAG